LSNTLVAGNTGGDCFKTSPFGTDHSGAGGSCTGAVTVGVPHDQGHGSLVDGGSLYNSTAP
jgi:hypothetical protein